VIVDDTGRRVFVPAEVRRVVSLVPSLTETVALDAAELLVGVTDWCAHPEDLDVARVGGTKNPDVPAIVALAPDLVLANREENRESDLDALRAAGLAVYVTDIRRVPGAFGSLTRMLAACGLKLPSWLAEAEDEWADAPGLTEDAPRLVVPIWRRPWMALGSDTFAGDVVQRLGFRNVLGEDPERYPRFDPGALPTVDLVLFPDEPYAFTPTDGPEAFEGTACAFVDGRSLTWYGPSLHGARARLTSMIAATR
jgi:ABC-type Fe3+-hydroxamate transport system substrate-binding protein